MEPAFRRYVEQCPDAVLVTDTGGRIVYANPAFERMTGYSSSELVGRTPALLKSGMHEADFYRRLWALGPPGVDVLLSIKRGGDPLDITVQSADRYDWLRLNPTY